MGQNSNDSNNVTINEDIISIDSKDNNQDDSVVDTKIEDSLPELKEYSGKTITIEIVAGAILGGLGVLLGFLWDVYVESLIGSVTFAPGMTWFDLLAVPILIAFFVFGIRSGLIAAVIACGSIAFYLTEPYGWLAMQPKFVASVSMFLIPWLILRVLKTRQRKDNKNRRFNYSSETFNPLANFIILMSITIVGRAIVMFVFNLFVTLPVYGWLFSGKETFSWVGTDPEFFLISAALYSSWNLVQGAADAAISYLIIYPTTLAKRFATW